MLIETRKMIGQTEILSLLYGFKSVVRMMFLRVCCILGFGRHFERSARALFQCARV